MVVVLTRGFLLGIGIGNFTIKESRNRESSCHGWQSISWQTFSQKLLN